MMKKCGLSSNEAVIRIIESVSNKQSHLTNCEKYAEDIVNLAGSASSFGFDNFNHKIKRCCEMSCFDCLFYSGEGEDCTECKNCWLGQEYTPYTISKRDRVFLDYIDNNYKYISKNPNGCICVSEETDDCVDVLPTCITADLPMIVPGCKKPWKIEDLKHLQIVDNY